MINVILLIKLIIIFFYILFTIIFGFVIFPMIGIKTNEGVYFLIIVSTIPSVFFLSLFGYIIIEFMDSLFNRIEKVISIKKEKIIAVIKLTWVYVFFSSPPGLLFFIIMILSSFFDPITRAVNLDLEMNHSRPMNLKGLKMYIKELKEIIAVQ